MHDGMNTSFDFDDVEDLTVYEDEDFDTEDVDLFEFCYYLDGVATPTAAPTTAQLPSIRAVSVAIVVRAARPDPDYTDTQTMTTDCGTNWAAANDNYRRRMARFRINMRNMGL